MAEYSVQRAGAGLISSEVTAVMPMGVGYPNTPGICSDAHVSGWSAITQAVHAAGTTMVLQRWHLGRISDPVYLNGQLAVAPSAVQPAGHVSLIRPMKGYMTPRALETEEIAEIVDAYRQGAENAKAAGFDGVEIHGASGYLLDQFLQSSTNQRTDRYGGSLENRARLLLEVTDAIIEVWGPAAWACTWRRGPTPMTWAMRTVLSPSSTSPASGASEALLLSVPARKKPMTASRPA
jgi:2,4-dienoyl-CoA reductase-like NADH-dependent reductase (Old Yellow Enzyme family)